MARGDQDITGRAALAIIGVIAVLIQLAAPPPASAAGSSRVYPVCGHVELGWASTILRSITTGQVQAVLVYSFEGGVTRLLPAPRGGLELLGVGGSRGQLWALFHDTMNGTLVIVMLPPLEKLANESITTQAVEAYVVKLENGFIERAYASPHNATAQVYAQTVFAKGNRSVTSLVRIDLSVRPEPKALAIKISFAGLALRGSTPCSAVLINETNETLDVAPLFVPRAQGVRVYHVPISGWPGVDPVSLVARRKIAGVVIASHARGLTSSLAIVDIDEHESRATLYLSEPLKDYFIIDPSQIARLNSTAYIIGARAIRSDGSPESIVIVADLGFNPKALIYRGPSGEALAVTDADRLIILGSSETRLIPYERIPEYLQLVAELSLNRTITGFTFEPVRAGEQVNTTIEPLSLRPPVEENTTTPPANTTSTPTTTGNNAPAPAKPQPAQPAPSKREGGTRRLIAVIAAAAILVAGGAGAYLVRRRSKREEIASPVLRY